MMSKVRRIRYSIRAAICLLVLFALILAPLTFFSRKAALKKADDLLLRRKDKLTDSLRVAVHSEVEWANDYTSSMSSWSESKGEKYRYTDPDGDIYSIEELVFSGNNYAFETDGMDIFNFSSFNFSSLYFGYYVYGFNVPEEDPLASNFIAEMKTKISDLSSLGFEEDLMGSVSGYRYLVTKAEVEVFYTDIQPGDDKPTEEHWTEDRYMLLTVEETPFLKEWKADMEKNVLALLITLLVCTSIIFVVEEKKGVKGIFMTPEKDDPKKETTGEPCEENVEFMSPSAAKALLAELDQVEKMTGENGYTRQIRDEIKKYL